MRCPYCNKDMVILQFETAIPSSWGTYTLYGCPKCKQVFWERNGSPEPGKKDRKGKLIRPKPIFDPTGHHDTHLIN